MICTTLRRDIETNFHRNIYSYDDDRMATVANRSVCTARRIA